MTKDLRVNSDRMLAAFNELALIGATGDGGVNRPAFSEAHLTARKWFRDEIERSGLEFRTDGAGNHSAFLALPAPVPQAQVSGEKRRRSAGGGVSAGDGAGATLWTTTYQLPL